MNIRRKDNRQLLKTRTKNDFGSRSRKRITKKKFKRRIKKSTVVKGAENRLKGFRQASILAVAITGFILIMFSADESMSSQQQQTVNQVDTVATEVISDSLVEMQGTEQAAGEAIGALQNMWDNFIYNYPKVLIAIGILIITWLLVRLIKVILYKSFRRMKSREGIVTLISIALWLLAIGIAISVVAGDIRALVGSFGLIGLALSWALQTPIESFTGWLMNVFRRYYKVGDRILVGDVFGDVYRIDFLSTTVWEIGSPYQPGFVNAEQPTGRLVTFPNNEILTGTVINLTGDFPFVWDELDVVVANESDIPLTMQVLKNIAVEVIGDYMRKPAENYAAILQRAGFTEEVPAEPEVYIAASDSWTNVIVRYLVNARQRRKWKTDLLLRTIAEINKPEYKGKILPVYPRQQVQIIDSGGAPVNINKD